MKPGEESSAPGRMAQVHKNPGLAAAEIFYALMSPRGMDHLEERYSTRSNFAPISRGHVAMSGDILVVILGWRWGATRI